MWAMIVVALMVLGTFVVVVGAPTEEEPNAPEEPIAYGACYGGSSERTVVVEFFTATWCQYCPPQAYANNRLSDELGHENYVVLEHHSSSSSLLYLPASGSRSSLYGVTGVPTAIFDGGGYYYGDANANGQAGATLWASGGTVKWQRYFDNRDAYEAEKPRTSNLTISLTGNLTSSEGKVLAHIEATDDITETNLKVRFMVYESNIYRGPHINGEFYLHHRVYNHIVRAFLTDYTVPVTFDQAGDTLDIERTFTIDGAWDIRTLGVAVMVQTDNSINYMYIPSMAPRNNYPILQAASMDYVPTGLIVVDGNDGDNMALDFDHYDELLTKGGFPHHNWDTHESRLVDTESDNARTMPQYASISAYPGVIWFTSSASSTLSLGSRNAIGSYLGGNGNMLVIGEEIADDANSNVWTVWLENYLHASFLNDDSGDTHVDGITGDPITNGLTGLTVTHNSPDVITPSGGTEIFVYSVSGSDVAAVRADHDSDSRVVYMSFDFFEGTNTEDVDTNDETLLKRIIDWLNGASAPDVDVLHPDGGETLGKLAQYDILWYANDVEMPETPVTIEYTTDSSSPTWISISTDEPNDGHFLWTTPDVDSAKCRVRVCADDSVGNSNCVMSDDDFTIGTPPLDTEPPNIYSVRLNSRVSEIVNPGDPVIVTAIVDDADSDVGGVNYTVDGGPMVAMSAQDGAFDEHNETVTAIIDTSGWGEATYTICVEEAWDVASNTNITSTACAPLTVTLSPIDNDPPEINNVLVNGQASVVVPEGAVVTLTARITDMTAVDNANYTIGAANWPGTVMMAIDGSYGGIDENVTASINTAGWAEDTYDACVYAADSLPYFNLTGACATIIVSSDFYPPEIYDVHINGQPVQSWNYDALPPDFFLTATIDDSTTGNSNIEYSNYTLGPSNWDGIKMWPDDIVYNNPVEYVQQIVTTPSDLGVYEYCVYAYDDKSNVNWTGSCATLNIVDPYPPEVLNVLVNGSKSTVVIVGVPVSLDATISDVSTGDSNIVSANYTDGITNWATSVAMLAADGDFDSSEEDVSVLIDTSTWTLGLHTICVYAEDAWGNANLSSADCVQMDVVASGPIPPLMLDAQLTGVGLGDVVVSWQASGDDGAGLDDVIEYEIYTGNLYVGPYNLVTTIPATDQPTYQHTCTGCGYGDPDNYFFYVKAFNGMEYSSSPNVAGKFVRHLTTGPQLVSLPLVLSDTSIEFVLQTIQFDKAWTYDASDSSDHWKSYEDAKPYKGDLLNIDYTKAFWVNVLAEEDWVVAGLVPVLTQIQLKAGWNLVSFASFNPIYTVGQLKSDVGVLEVEGHNPSIPYCLTRLADMDMMTSGKGYWIYVDVDVLWDITQ